MRRGWMAIVVGLFVGGCDVEEPASFRQSGTYKPILVGTISLLDMECLEQDAVDEFVTEAQNTCIEEDGAFDYEIDCSGTSPDEIFECDSSMCVVTTDCNK